MPSPTDMKNKNIALKTALGGILCAQALALSFIENLLPAIPFMPPGAKPGLPNIIIMFAAGSLGAPQAFIITLVKSGFVFITRGATAAVMSLSGGLLACTATVILMRFCKEKLGIIGISVTAALCHNLGQLAASVFITGSAKTLYYAPFLALFGLVTGIATGLIFRAVLPALEKQRKYFYKS